MTADVGAVQGIKATKSKPNSYLYQALALMATELKYTEEARQWFMEGTKTVMVSCQHATLHCLLPSTHSTHFLFLLLSYCAVFSVVARFGTLAIVLVWGGPASFADADMGLDTGPRQSFYVVVLACQQIHLRVSCCMFWV